MRQLDLTERLLRLRSVPMFRGMNTSHLAPLAASMRYATFDKGDILLREDEPPRAFFMLMTGSVTMRRRGWQIRTIDAPGGVGFLSLLARTGGGTEAVANSRTEAFEVRRDAIDEIFEDHFSVLLGTMRWVTERLVQENLQQPPPPYDPPKDGVEHLISDRELGIVERIFLLRRTRMFKHANVNSTARLARRMKEHRVPAGEVLWRPGEKATTSLFIVKGKMETRREDDPSWVQTVGPGYVVGGAEALSASLRWNRLVTLEPAVYLEGSRENLIDMFEDDLDVALNFLSMMATFLLTLWDRKAEVEARAAEGVPMSEPTASTAPSQIPEPPESNPSPPS